MLNDRVLREFGKTFRREFFFIAQSLKFVHSH